MNYFLTEMNKTEAINQLFSYSKLLFHPTLTEIYPSFVEFKTFLQLMVIILKKIYFFLKNLFRYQIFFVHDELNLYFF